MMHQIKNITILFTLLLLTACIKPFDPMIESNAENKYVVSGKVTDIEGWQEVNISMSSAIENPVYIPVSGCLVNILDNRGNSFTLDEYGPGSYRTWLGKEYLVPGTSFKVTVNTPEGEAFESTFDTLAQGPPLDSVYYLIENIPTSDPSFYLTGMQFYVDLNAEGFETRFYKWEVVETWEFEAAHPVEYYYDGDWHQVLPPDSTNKVCWSNGLVKNVYTLSTKSLSQNAFYQFPLHFVDGTTSRLGILYSILVRQLALSEGAYNYWEQLRINSTEAGGLYEKQPVAIKGNLSNVTNPEKEVLGYFYTASESTRRYFYKNVEGVELTFINYCNEEELGYGGWKKFRYYDYPVFYYYNQFLGLRILNAECVDCRLMGGTTTKPDFWPE